MDLADIMFSERIADAEGGVLVRVVAAYTVEGGARIASGDHPDPIFRPFFNFIIFS